MPFVDLHSHTTESDGTLTPEELIALAVKSELKALAITDHDTFLGYEKAVPFAQNAGLELIRGIELNSRFRLPDGALRWVHVLAYFAPNQVRSPFLDWLKSQADDRRERNRKLAAALQQRGVNVTLAEVEAKGKSLAGRPHFAQVLVEKGYAGDSDDAFRRFIGEDAPCFVKRQSSTTEEVIAIIRAGGGVPVVAHPVRIGLAHDEIEVRVLKQLKEAGLGGLEVQHSEQPWDLQHYYSRLADGLGLLPTGGSDFHGGPKPDIELGSGRAGNVRVPYDVLSRLKIAIAGCGMAHSTAGSK